MKVSEFAKKNKFNNVDKNIVEKLHKNEDKTEQEWFNLFNGKINFDSTPYVSKSRKMEKIGQIKKGNVESKKI